MPIPTWTVGEVLAAADVNQWFVPLAAVKASGQTVASSTTLVTDTTLLLPVTANGIWLVQGVIEFNAPTTGTGGAGDLKWSFTIPASTSGFYGASYTNLAGTAFVGGAAQAWTDTVSASGSGVSTSLTLRITGILNTAGTAGNLQFKWAQNTSNSTATTVMGNSALVAQQIS